MSTAPGGRDSEAAVTSNVSVLVSSRNKPYLSLRSGTVGCDEPDPAAELLLWVVRSTREELPGLFLFLSLANSDISNDINGLRMV